MLIPVQNLWDELRMELLPAFLEGCQALFALVLLMGISCPGSQPSLHHPVPCASIPVDVPWRKGCGATGSGWVRQSLHNSGPGMK